ncbi:MAG: hypothetical protein RL607_1945 [Bacteroidota bacterium]|jgi:hypothetical protein
MKKNFLFTLLAILVIQPLFAQVPSYVPTNGLVGYWPFNGNANDESGNGNNGTNNGAILATDRFGYINSCYFFQNNNISIPHNPSFGFQATSAITISMWCNSSDVSNISHFMGKRADSSPYFNWQIAYGGSVIGPSFGSGTGPGIYNGAFSSDLFLINNWYHIVGKFDNGVWLLYVNGILKATNNTAIVNPDSNTPITVGSSGNFQGYYGKLDDIGIWNRALTQQEITNLYNSVSSSECLTMVINSGPLSTNPVTYTSTVNIFPNPANNQITIDCGNLANVVGWNIKITNALGQEVFSAPMNTQLYVVPLNSWSGQGMYFVKILNAQNEVMNIKKIILQ